METGRVLADRYELGEMLGQGGMGAVYAGIDRRLSRAVAIKLLREGTADAEALQRFRREAHAAAALGNPHIVHVSDFQENPGEPAFIVMEKIAGTSLRGVISRDGKLRPQRACKIAAQVLFALDAAHRVGILHRDIKPENIIVSTTPAGDIAKVVDFGLAGAVDGRTGQPVVLTIQTTLTNGVVGTVGYIAPERLMGSPADARADVYAVGATLFYLLAGKRAFDGLSSAEWAARALQLVPRLDAVVPGIEPALAEVVARAMAIDPANRYATAADFLRALDPWLDGVVLATTRQLPVEAMQKRAAPALDLATLPLHPDMPKPDRSAENIPRHTKLAIRVIVFALIALTVFAIYREKRRGDAIPEPHGDGSYKSLGKQQKTNAERSEKKLSN